jgi:hypothetical protein
MQEPGFMQELRLCAKARSLYKAISIQELGLFARAQALYKALFIHELGLSIRLSLYTSSGSM